MLRITPIDTAGHGVRLRVEGRLAGSDVEELRRSCDAALVPDAPLTLDLADALFLDRDGVALVQSLRSRGVAVVNCSPFVAEQLRAGAAC